MADSEAFAQLERAWFLIRDHFDDLYQAADDEGRARLIGERDGARDAYYLALGKQFDDGDAQVAQVTRELRNIEQQLRVDLQNLQDIVESLKLFAAVVRLMGSLASLVAI